MTPQDLAAEYPRLFHIIDTGMWESVERHGLLSSVQLLSLFGVSAEIAEALVTNRRADAVALTRDGVRSAVLNDNKPLHEGKLARCLDDGLRSSDWLLILNKRVFFWASEDRVHRFLGARGAQDRQREVVTFDTLRLVSAYAERVELCPINSGSTAHNPTRRGHATFTPMLRHTLDAWRRLRPTKAPDKVVEVVVRDAVPDAAKFMIEKCSAAEWLARHPRPPARRSIDS